MTYNDVVVDISEHKLSKLSLEAYDRYFFRKDISNYVSLGNKIKMGIDSVKNLGISEEDRTLCAKKLLELTGSIEAPSNPVEDYLFVY